MTDIPKQKSGLAAFLFWNIIFHQPPEFLRYCIDEGFQNLQKEVKIWDSRLAAQRISENLPALLLWTILNIAMLCGWTLAGKKSPLGKTPALPLGGHGRIFGYDNDYENHHFNGVSMRTQEKDGTAWFSVTNYRIIERCQRYTHSNFRAKAEAMNGATLGAPADEANSAMPELIADGFISCQNGVLSAEFPVFEESVFNRLCEIIKPISEAVSDCMTGISDKAAAILAEHAPESVRLQCADIAKIHHRLDVTAVLMEKMVENGDLIVPNERVNLCIFGVKTKA